MEGLLSFAMWAVMILIGLTLLIIVAAGLRNIAAGKVSILTAVMVAVPILLLGVLGFVMGDWVLAAIWTTIIALVISLVALLIAGLRSMATF